MNWNGKTVAITGGSSGIGFAIAEKLGPLGAEVLLIARNPEKLLGAKSRLESRGIKCSVYSCDVSSLSQCVSTFDKIIFEHRAVDVFINNAGYTYFKTLQESSLEELDHISRTNFQGALYFSKLFCDWSVKQGSANTLVNISSIAGRIPITPSAIYSAAKHGLSALTELLRLEYEAFGVRVLHVLPGRVETAFFDHPTFKARTQGAENTGILSVDFAAGKIVLAIERGQRELVFPSRFRLIAWAYFTFPFIIKRFVQKILLRRLLEHREFRSKSL